ncbi:MAG: hypothetical protein ABSE48_14460 [Verrucomicrobiota bacterium]|jgi:hypothetical protein
MDQSSIVRGIGVFVYLVILAVLLFVILIRQGVPRRAALETVEISAGIFVVALFITYKIADRVVLDGGDSLLIYIPPVIPVGIFVFWLLRRRKKIQK